ncbi:MAG: glycosyltransferase family 2 protein, partial [Pseudobutyrivibrio sp.]|nr:glycosyltransferase family 2 protein [Pseudobutyrivibrio sp.]
MKTALSTVIYKQAHPYLQDLLTSVDNQSDKDFDLLIINDNYTKAELEEVEKQIHNTVHGINIHIEDISDKHLSIAGTRIEMLKTAKCLGYESLVLVDADDTISPTRMESFIKSFELDKDRVFFYNKFVTETGKDVFKTLPDAVEDIKPIAQANFLGLSNTGIRISCLSDDFLDSLNEGAVAVFDWYLFSRIIMDIGTGAYVDNAATIYRIYD